MEDIPEVDVTVWATGHQRGCILFVYSRLQEHQLGDTQVSIHCNNMITSLYRAWINSTKYSLVQQGLV